MTTKTDFHSIQELKEKYTPANCGFCTGAEVALIREVLELDARNNIELQNVRDMSVMLYGQWSNNLRSHERHAEAMQISDAMSAVCCVIDDEKFKRGMEV